MIGMFTRRRGLLTASAAALFLLVALVVSAAPAAATVIHVKEGSFNGSEAPGGAFGFFLVSDAVDQANGDVWVAEFNPFGGPSRVDKFKEDGTYAGVELTGVPTIPGQEAFAFGGGSGVAVDNTAGANKGDLYVGDTGHGVVDRFDETGKFVCQITGKAPTTLEEEEQEEKFGCQGKQGSPTPDGSIEPDGIAVDASGDVYVGDGTHEAIDKFSPAGAYISQIKDPHLDAAMRSVALDSEGSLYVWGGDESGLVKFDSTGAFVGVIDSNSQGAGVDPQTGNVYAPEAGERGIYEFEPSGALLDVIPIPGEAFLGGMAVNATTGKLYAAEIIHGNVAIFSPDIAVPTVTMGESTPVIETGATLHAHLDPDAAHGGGEITECQVEYGTTSSYGQVAPCSPGGPYAGAVDVSAEIGGLVKSTTYHFRVKVANATASGYGEDGTLTTAGPPTIDGEFAHVNGTSTTLWALINPFHEDTKCQGVQYVDEASFQSSGYAQATTVPCDREDLGSGFGDQRAEASTTISGLAIGTTYHYRFLASNDAGAVSLDHTFLTFGAHEAKFDVVDKEELPFTQAAGHPYEWQTSFHINQFVRSIDETGIEGSPFGVDANFKDVFTDLPPGLIGDPQATLRCTRLQVEKFKCPPGAQVGVIAVNLEAPSETGLEGNQFPLYNVVPPKGVLAEFSFTIRGGIVDGFIDVKLRSGGDYGVTAGSTNVTALAGIREIIIDLWGVPADPSHDGERCLSPEGGIGHSCPANEPLKPFLRNPTSCTGPLAMTYALDSWQNVGLFAETNIGMPAITGCEQVPFDPSIEVHPTTTAADSPSGLHLDLHLPQNEAPEGLAEGDLKDATITLPAGLAVNTSAADGLTGCSEAQIGFTGFKELYPASEPGVKTPQFTPTPEECPDSSKLGRIEVDTPLIGHPLPGAIYLARQGENPFGSLLGVYLTVYDPITGLVVKLPGRLEADPLTGQLSAIVDQNPQLAFEDFKIDLFEGARSPLTTPATCGTFTTTSSLAPWSGNAAMSPVSAFEVDEVPGSGVCAKTAAEEPDAPSFAAGTFTPVAGAFSPLVVRVAREDGSQQVGGLSVTLPPGLLGKIAGVAQCPQADIDAATRRGGLGEGGLEQANPSCPATSEVGVAHVGVGSGAPFHVSGRAYLAGPYEGAPFSIVVITPAVGGPFDLGTVVVRSALFIDPATAQVTVRTDQLPTILDGIPLDIRSIDVEAVRNQFTLNPTSCEKMSVNATVLSTAGASAGVSSPFKVGGCTNLPFKPSLTASTAGATNRAKGASLSVKVTQSPGEANVAKVDVQLPKALPARLKTLQKACTEAQFNANPAGCPAASDVAYATVHTPILSAPLTGPAYFVSHGNAAFPNLDIVLEGEGVKIVLSGDTDIKGGITYSRFEAVPDAPFSSFELTAPQGPYSIFAATLPAGANSLCGQTLTMPTTLTGQNGVVLEQQTQLAVTGCGSKAAGRKALTRAQRLTRALKACRKQNHGRRGRQRREACERRAHARYGPHKTGKRKGR